MKIMKIAVIAIRIGRKTAMTSSAKRRASSMPAFAVETLAEERHETRCERAFAEQAAEEVRDQEGHREGVCGHPGAHDPGEHHLAGEAEHAADHGQAADRAGRLDEVHCRLPVRGSSQASPVSSDAWAPVDSACICAARCM
jgi:hypothetical protein